MLAELVGLEGQAGRSAGTCRPSQPGSGSDGTPASTDGPALAVRIRIATVETRSFWVTGMSCEHCARAVRAEIVKLPGVTDVDVDVVAGEVRITGEPLPDDAAVRDAVHEAGYEFAG
jgi:copper chaperone